MKTIHKYRLSGQNINEIIMPLNSQILTLQMQNEVPHIWVIVDPKELPSIRMIRTFMTGRNIPGYYNGMYVGTYQLYEEKIVKHVFDEGYKRVVK